MKTTVELPDELVIEAKKRAAELRQPLRVLIEKGLRAELASAGGRAKRKAAARVKVRWCTVNGGLPEGLAVDDREAMHEWLGREG